MAYLNLESLNLKIGRRKRVGKEHEKRQTIKARIRSKQPYIITIPMFLDATGAYPARLVWRTAKIFLADVSYASFHPFRDVPARRQHEAIYGSQDKFVIAVFNVDQHHVADHA